MENDYLDRTRTQNAELRSTIQRFDEAQARTHALQEDFERLFAENQALLKKLLAQDYYPLSPLPSSCCSSEPDR